MLRKAEDHQPRVELLSETDIDNRIAYVLQMGPMMRSQVSGQIGILMQQRIVMTEKQEHVLDHEILGITRPAFRAVPHSLNPKTPKDRLPPQHSLHGMIETPDGWMQPNLEEE